MSRDWYKCFGVASAVILCTFDGEQTVSSLTGDPISVSRPTLLCSGDTEADRTILLFVLFLGVLGDATIFIGDFVISCNKTTQCFGDWLS